MGVVSNLESRVLKVIAHRTVTLVGGEEAIRPAVCRPVARASGLGWRLWGGAPGDQRG